MLVPSPDGQRLRQIEVSEPDRLRDTVWWQKNIWVLLVPWPGLSPTGAVALAANLAATASPSINSQLAVRGRVLAEVANLPREP